MAASLFLSAAGVDDGVALATLMLKTVLIRACGVRAPYTDGGRGRAGAGACDPQVSTYVHRHKSKMNKYTFRLNLKKFFP